MNHIRDLESKIYDKIFTRNSATVPTPQMNFEPHPALSSSPSSRRSNGENHIPIVGEEPQSPLLSHSFHTTHHRNYSNKHSPELFEMELGTSADSAKRSAPVKVQGQKIKHTDEEVNSLMNTIYDQISGSFNSTTPNSSGSENSAASSVLNSLASSLNSFKSGAAMLDTFAQQFLTSNNSASHLSKTRQHNRSNSDQTFFDQQNEQVITNSSCNTVNASTTTNASLPTVSSSVPSTFEPKNVRRARSNTVSASQKKPPKQKYFKAHAVESDEEEEEMSRNDKNSQNQNKTTKTAPEKKSTSTSSSSSFSEKQEHLSTKANKKEMLTLFLLRHICSSINPDPQFFVNTCKKLHSEGYISDLHNCDLVLMKEQSKDFMLDFINNWPVAFTQEERNCQVECASTSTDTDFSSIKKSVSQDSYLDRMASRETKEMTSSIPFFNSMFLNFSRVKTDFKNRKILGKGAFGHVFQMEHKIDGVTYAVKRIKLCFRDFSQFEEEYNRVIREVKALATLIHPNIVAYNNCWFELCSHTDSVLDSQSHPFNQTDVYSFHPSTNEESVYTEDAATPSTPTNDMSTNNRSYIVPYKTPKSFLSSVSDTENSEFIFEFEKDASESHSLVETEGKLNYSIETGSNSPSLKSSQPTHNIMLQDSLGNDLIAEDALKNLLSYIYNEKNKRFEIYLFIQMQLCENYTLQDWLWSDERIKENQVDLRKILIYFYQIADAVSYVHAKGIIHRDLKPSNIFLSRTERSEIRIGDFGLSKFVKPPIPGRDTTPNTPLYENPRMFSSTSTFESFQENHSTSSDSSNHTSGLGTVTYASPEQLNQNMYDSKSDIFSLGIILYEMLHPFKTKTERAFVLQDLRRGKYASHIAEVYPGEMQIVKKCLSLEASNRPSAEEIKQMILKIQYERKFVEMPCSVLSQEEKSTEQLEEEIKLLQMQLQRLTAQLKNKQK